MEGHKTHYVEYGAMEAEIDVEIAPLILEIWRAGLVTVNSCQENRPGWVWIQFFTAEHAAAFLDIVAVYEEGVDCLYNRIRHGWDHQDGPPDGLWEYDALPEDLAVLQEEIEDGMIDEASEGPSHFIFGMSIRFPNADLPIVEERMKLHNEGTQRAEEAEQSDASQIRKAVVTADGHSIAVDVGYGDEDVRVWMPHWGLGLSLDDAHELRRRLEACGRGCEKVLDGEVAPQLGHVGVECDDDDSCFHLYFGRPWFAWCDVDEDQAEQLLLQLNEELEHGEPVSSSPSLVAETADGGVDG